LEKVLDEFPYFQSARALRLKDFITKIVLNITLHLKVTANTSILFDFITSDSFNAIQKHFLKKKKQIILHCNCQKSVFKEIEHHHFRSILSSIKEATPIKKDKKKHEEN
jgi:hypothetical protein